jgi:aminobenzoyl-glutamate utilization protein B
MSKLAVFELIDQNEAELKSMASTIWEYAETAMKEFRSAKLQKDYLADQGFVIREIPNVPTSFIAEFGSGSPIIGILGEYDALPTMSQKIQATRERSEAVRTGTAAATT